MKVERRPAARFVYPPLSDPSSICMRACFFCFLFYEPVRSPGPQLEHTQKTTEEEKVEEALFFLLQRPRLASLSVFIWSRTGACLYVQA